MAETITADLCIIGAGAGGLALAAAAAAHGVPTVLIEHHAMGGDGLNTGLASKALLAAAKRAAVARHGLAFGVSANVTVDFAAVQRHVQMAMAAVARASSPPRFAGLGVRVVKGQAKFKDRRTVVVGENEIRARRIVIATGSTSAVPSIPGLDSGPYLTSETVFSLTQLPARLIVLGADSAGLERAQAFRRLGSEVTVLATTLPLADDDPEAAEIVLAQLEREGIVIRNGVKIDHVSYIAHSVAATIEADGRQEMIEGSHLLVAAGRKPATDGLDLEAARIKHDAAGIAVNRKLKTSNGRVYAIGDVTAGHMRSAQMATYHAGLVAKSVVFHARARVDKYAVPRVTFTEPELAQAGMSEAEARGRRLKVRIVRWPYHDNDRAHAERIPHGHVKVICDRKGKILGATIVGVQAGELIATWNFAMSQGLNIRSLAEFALPYPTLSEIGKCVAIDFFTPNLTRPWVRRIISWLRIFG